MLGNAKREKGAKEEKKHVILYVNRIFAVYDKLN